MSHINKILWSNKKIGTLLKPIFSIQDSIVEGYVTQIKMIGSGSLAMGFTIYREGKSVTWKMG